MPDTQIINLTADPYPVLKGADEGAKLRRVFKLDEVDHNSCSVVVKIDADVYAVTRSFFRGLFFDSLVKIGCDKLFFDKFKFECDSSQLSRFHDYARELLMCHRIFSM